MPAFKYPDEKFFNVLNCTYVQHTRTKHHLLDRSSTWLIRQAEMVGYILGVVKQSLVEMRNISYQICDMCIIENNSYHELRKVPAVPDHRFGCQQGCRCKDKRCPGELQCPCPSSYSPIHHHPCLTCHDDRMIGWNTKWHRQK